VLLQLTGTTSLERDQQHLLVGDKLFFDLVISASQKTDTDPTRYDDDSYEQKVNTNTLQCNCAIQYSLQSRMAEREKAIPPLQFWTVGNLFENFSVENFACNEANFKIEKPLSHL